MAFPNSIETGVGLAGPTADIGHEAAHAAAGIPRLLEELQTSIGVQRTPSSWTPTWNTGTQPSTNTGLWASYGPIVWAHVSATWTAATTASYTLAITGGFPSWGTPWGTNPNTHWLGLGFGFNGAVYWTGSQFQFFARATNDTLATIPNGATVHMQMILWVP